MVFQISNRFDGADTHLHEKLIKFLEHLNSKIKLLSADKVYDRTNSTLKDEFLVEISYCRDRNDVQEMR